MLRLLLVLSASVLFAAPSVAQERRPPMGSPERGMDAAPHAQRRPGHSFEQPRPGTLKPMYNERNSLHLDRRQPSPRSRTPTPGFEGSSRDVQRPPSIDEYMNR